MPRGAQVSRAAAFAVNPPSRKDLSGREFIQGCHRRQQMRHRINTFSVVASISQRSARGQLCRHSSQRRFVTVYSRSQGKVQLQPPWRHNHQRLVHAVAGCKMLYKPHASHTVIEGGMERSEKGAPRIDAYQHKRHGPTPPRRL